MTQGYKRVVGSQRCGRVFSRKAKVKGQRCEHKPQVKGSPPKTPRCYSAARGGEDS